MSCTARQGPGLGSAKEGTEHFWKQRLTAVSNLILVSIVLVLVVSWPAPTAHGEAHWPSRRTLSCCFCWYFPASSTCG
jgi:succinate dehydrogenase hydrophobic anchor subunit